MTANDPEFEVRMKFPTVPPQNRLLTPNAFDKYVVKLLSEFRAAEQEKAK